MSELTVTLFSGVACDSQTCDARLEGEAMSYFKGKRHYAELATAAGWQCWAGRGRRWYCPGCAPRDGHRMRLVHGHPREAKRERGTQG